MILLKTITDLHSEPITTGSPIYVTELGQDSGIAIVDRVTSKFFYFRYNNKMYHANYKGKTSSKSLIINNFLWKDIPKHYLFVKYNGESYSCLFSEGLFYTNTGDTVIIDSHPFNFISL